MTIVASGVLSLGGNATSGGLTQSIELELYNGGQGYNSAGTATISMNDTAARNLAGIGSGTISVSNFYGKSSRVNISYTFTASTANASLNVSTISGYLAGISNITITVNSGVYLYATTTGNYGLTLTGGTAGDVITFVNNGYIIGCGGTGGNSGAAGSVGGPALSLGYNITLVNNSYIAGGGGGGGGNYGSNTNYSGGGGGGAGGGTGGSGRYSSNSYAGGAGGGLGATGGNGVGAYPFGYGGGSGGGGAEYDGSGGGGGRILPGTGGAAGANVGGVGGSGNAAGGTPPTTGAGGGGGWGAAGGTGKWSGYHGAAGAAGGNAISLNGHSIAYSTTGYIWGAVA